MPIPLMHCVVRTGKDYAWGWNGGLVAVPRQEAVLWVDFRLAADVLLAYQERELGNEDRAMLTQKSLTTQVAANLPC